MPIATSASGSRRRERSRRPWQRADQAVAREGARCDRWAATPCASMDCSSGSNTLTSPVDGFIVPMNATSRTNAMCRLGSRARSPP